MAKQRAKIGRTATDIAEELAKVRDEMSILKSTGDFLSEELKDRLKKGEKQGLFKLVESTSLAISDGKKVMAWAAKYAPMVITVNTSAARKLFLGDIATGSMGTPESHGFTHKTIESLKQVGAKREVAQDLPDIN